MASMQGSHNPEPARTPGGLVNHPALGPLTDYEFRFYKAARDCQPGGFIEWPRHLSYAVGNRSLTHVRSEQGDKDILVRAPRVPVQASMASIDRIAEVNDLLTSKAVSHDPVNAPSHYTRFAIEPITFIMANGLPFDTGNIIKYVVRAPYKGNEIEDLKKARRMLDMKIEQLENPRSVERL